MVNHIILFLTGGGGVCVGGALERFARRSGKCIYRLPRSRDGDNFLRYKPNGHIFLALRDRDEAINPVFLNWFKNAMEIEYNGGFPANCRAWFGDMEGAICLENGIPRK